jgi:LETM1 and EF-hand domain-containing protein 1
MIKNLFIKEKSALTLSEGYRTKKDLMKFVPFSFFLLVPFAELLLPPDLFFFPNSLPTTYIFDD